MIKFFFKFKKPYFWPISPVLGAKKNFPKNLAVTHKVIRVSGTMPNSEKSNGQLDQENTQTDGKTKGQTASIS